MGYTHYQKQQRDFTDQEWTAIKQGFESIRAKSGIPLTGGSSDEFIAFNGVEDDGHETFVLNKIKSSDFEFCKTARKPYDVVVTAFLLFVDHIAPGALEISSNGDMDGEEWQPGRELFESIK